MQKNEVGHLPLTSYTKINSKWLDLNIRAKTIKLLERNMGVNLCDLQLGSDFLDTAQKAQVTVEKTDTLNFIKI